MKNRTAIKLIIILAAIVVISMLTLLVEGNYLMLGRITTESLKSVTFVKSVGFSIAALIIIVYDKRIWVKLMFVILDMALVFCLQFFEADVWTEIGAFIYSPYVGLNLFFIGMIISDELRKVLDSNSVKAINENTANELAETRKNLELQAIELSSAKTKIVSLLDQKLVNAKRGRGADKDAYVKKVQTEIEVTKENFGIK